MPSEYPEQAGELYECGKGCGRQFNANVLAKHEKICELKGNSKVKGSKNLPSMQIK